MSFLICSIYAYITSVFKNEIAMTKLSFYVDLCSSRYVNTFIFGGGFNTEPNR